MCISAGKRHSSLYRTQSLAGVDDTVTRMKIKLQQLDEDIRTVVREQAESGHDGRQVGGRGGGGEGRG